MTAPNRYVLGGTPEIDVTTTDQNGITFVPVAMRLSIKQPDGVIITLSGGDLTIASGYMYYLYRPLTIGWYEYESWVRDGTGREDTATNGFDVYDRVY